MSDDIETTSPELETLAEEVEQDVYEDDQEVTEDTEPEDSEEQPEDTVDDSEEIEFNQKQYKLPKDIAVAVKDMQKDYTVKTQSLAEQRKTFESQAQFHQAHIQEIAEVVALNKQLDEFKNVDLFALSEQDPVKAQQLMFYKSGLEEQRNMLAQSISQKQQNLALEKQQEIAKRIEESESVLRREIKDWSPELEGKLQQFAVSKLGFDINDVKSSKADPRLYKLLHLAYVGNQIIQKQPAKPKIVQQAKPVTTLKSGGDKSLRNPKDMSQAEYAKWRRKGYA